MSLEFSLNGFVSLGQIHKKFISAVDIDKSGNRLITGSLDNTIKMWDFSGMTKRIKNFRKITPVEGIALNHLSWNPSSSNFLACPDTSSAFIYTRNGEAVGQTAKGDMYLKDLNNTTGHICQINGGAWDETNKERIATWANDGTMRIWDVNRLKKNVNVLKLKNRQNIKYNCSCGLIVGNSFIISGSSEGSLHIWDYKRPVRAKVVRNAHSKGSDISSILVKDQISLFTKSCDGSIKKWDLRKMKTNLTEQKAPNENSFCKMVFSSSKNVIATLKYEENADDNSNYLIFLNSDNLEINKTLSLNTEGVCIAWNDRINQIGIATIERELQFYYTANSSKKGALLCSESREYALSDEDSLQILDRNMLREARSKEAEDSGQKAIQMPQMSKDEKNKVVVTTSFAAGILRQQKRIIERDRNPRESLLRYDKKIKENPFFVK